MGAYAWEHFGIKQLNGLSPDPQNPKDYAQAFLSFLLPSLIPSIHIHLFVYLYVDTSILVPIHRNKCLTICFMPGTVLGAETVR